jgi:magnesium-transporting ATPase (P-type)
LVIRNGKRILIAGREVVRDDLTVISEGDWVAADATLISSQDLLLDESLLTGEAMPVRKLAKDAPVAAEDQSAVRNQAVKIYLISSPERWLCAALSRRWYTRQASLVKWVRLVDLLVALN